MEFIGEYECFKDLSNRFNKTYLDFEKLISTSKNYTKEEIEIIKKAYIIASHFHYGQKRKSGEDFIIHPLNVAYLLASYGFDYETICAALLHDTIEDTNYTKEQLKNDFGNVICSLVDGVTKMKGSSFLSKKEAEILTHKKILDSITKDARIISIKLADRLHNMFTLDNLSYEKQIEISTETNEFYVNLARILGIYQMKDELQDLSLFYLNKDLFLKYYEIRENIKERYYDDYKYIAEEVKYSLNKINIPMSYNYKIKNVSGIFNEVSLGMNLFNINDLVAVRMISENIMDCYKILEIVKKINYVVPSSFKDMIKEPKYNGYKTLNINIKTINDNNFQVRIRTYDMQRTNELGIVNNWTLESQKILNNKCKTMFKENKKELEEKIYKFKK